MRALLLLLLFVCGAWATWNTCGKGALTISSATITPDPPPRGKNFNVTYIGHIATAQTGGTQEFSVYEKVFGHWIQGPFSTTFDICKNNKCPWGPSTQLIMTEELPSFVPSGDYKVRVTVKNDAKELLACLEVEFALT
eukprot:TRINITY_DN11747_c0_g1_i1.p1 TRINITY_DN11747_c0_g1~~TRINITY_DN11747_c0_g1_i1.p1  ORF type:complete len:138 (+),score=13.33 TRINITY_DN11747_c0_g1_i1:31-444(+)